MTGLLLLSSNFPTVLKSNICNILSKYRIKYYGPDCMYYVLRMTAAFFSTLTPPLLYLAARLMGARAAGGVLAAGLLIFDGIAIGEGRHVLVRAYAAHGINARVVSAD